MVEAYIERLIAFPALQVPDFVDSYFNLALQQLGEGWRRFFHEQQRFPSKLFKFACLSHTDFMKEYRNLQSLEAACRECFDVEFTSILLQYIPESEDDSSDAVMAKSECLRRFLSDTAVWAPISADIVECLHGSCQSRLHRFRGQKPADETARQTIVLDKITSAYGKFKEFMWSHFGDKFAFKRLVSYNQKKGNQYTSKPYDVSCKRHAYTTEDLDRMLATNSFPSAPRKLCGSLAVKTIP